MRVLLQRVSRAEVRVDGAAVGTIGTGLLAFVGIEPSDSAVEIEYYAKKTVELRLFPDDDGKMNRSLLDIGGEVLVVSQFTLMARTRRGRRPSYTDAATPETAERLYRAFGDELAASGVRVQRGSFGAHMEVDLVNDGPVTILLEAPAGSSREPRS